MCGVDGCSYKMVNTTTMWKHKAKKHGISEYVMKIPGDGKERDKWGNIIRVCGIDACSFKTGNMTNMRRHKASRNKQPHS